MYESFTVDRGLFYQNSCRHRGVTQGKILRQKNRPFPACAATPMLEIWGLGFCHATAPALAAFFACYSTHNIEPAVERKRGRGSETEKTTTWEPKGGRGCGFKAILDTQEGEITEQKDANHQAGAREEFFCREHEPCQGAHGFLFRASDRGVDSSPLCAI
jgi:hypothetical protein